MLKCPPISIRPWKNSLPERSTQRSDHTAIKKVEFRVASYLLTLGPGKGKQKETKQRVFEYLIVRPHRIVRDRNFAANAEKIYLGAVFRGHQGQKPKKRAEVPQLCLDLDFFPDVRFRVGSQYFDTALVILSKVNGGKRPEPEYLFKIEYSAKFVKC